MVRYGQNFRGVKSFVATEYGCVGVIIYSDPWDDGYFKGDKYPKGPYRPDTGVQRGSIQYLSHYPGDPTTPGIASVPDLPDSKRISPDQATDMPRIPTTPLSYHDAAPILANLGGAGVAARLAGRATVHLSRRARTGEGPHAAQAELSVDDHLRRHRHGEGKRASRAVGRYRQPSRRVGVWSGRSEQRHGSATGSCTWRRRVAEDGMEAEAHHRVRQLGRGRRRL